MTNRRLLPRSKSEPIEIVEEPSGNALPEGISAAAVKICLGLLKTRDRLKADVLARLVSRGIPETSAVAAVDYVWERLNIDERSVVLNLAKQMRGLSRRAVIDRLASQGASAEDIEAAVKSLDDRLLLSQLVTERRARGDSDQKLWRYLLSKGFEEDEVLSVLGMD